MDPHAFDRLARAVARPGLTRRGFLRGALGAGATALAGGRARGAPAATETKLLCHFTTSPNKPYEVIAVDKPAWATHFGHGDMEFVDCCMDADCSSGQVCIDGACAAIAGGRGDLCTRSSDTDYQGTCGEDLYCYDDGRCDLRCIQEDFEPCVANRRICCADPLAALNDRGECPDGGTPARCPV